MSFVCDFYIIFLVEIDSLFNSPEIILAARTVIQVQFNISAVFRVKVLAQTLANMFHNIFAGNITFHICIASLISFLKKALALCSLLLTAATVSWVTFAVSSVDNPSTSLSRNTIL